MDLGDKTDIIRVHPCNPLNLCSIKIFPLKITSFFCKFEQMNAVIKINTADLTEQIIHDLQEKYGTAKLEIRVRSEHEKEVLSDSEFWRIIALLDWKKTGDDAAVIAPAVDELSKLPVAFIYQFQDKLAEKLYQLDTQIHAENCGVNRWQSDKYFSVDVFLYERCCVVANGKDFYEKVLADATQMPKDIDFEPLLYIAANAYEKQTNTPMQYAPVMNYETFSNKSAWSVPTTLAVAE